MNKAKESRPFLNIETILPILDEISIFAGLNESQLYRVFHLLELVNYKKGEFIFETGDQPSHIYIVKKGLVKLMLNVGTFKIEKALFKEGECFGESAAIGIMPHIADTIAVKDTELIVISRKTLLNLFETDKELFGILILNIARELSRRLHYTEDILLHYVGTTAKT